LLMTREMTENQALHYAGLLFSVFDEFPRNLPFFSTRVDPLNPAARLDDSEAPVLHALLSTLWMYPPAGQWVDVGGVRLESRFAVEGADVSLTVMLSKAPGGIV
jgi:hypothetical protein